MWLGQKETGCDSFDGHDGLWKHTALSCAVIVGCRIKVEIPVQSQSMFVHSALVTRLYMLKLLLCSIITQLDYLQWIGVGIVRVFVVPYFPVLCFKRMFTLSFHWSCAPLTSKVSMCTCAAAAVVKWKEWLYEPTAERSTKPRCVTAVVAGVFPGWLQTGYEEEATRETLSYLKFVFSRK